jgi:transposase
MSKEWIQKNIGDAVSERLADQVSASYSRHLFYAPLYHPKQSPKEHAEARLNNGDETTHASHSAFHYADSEIKSFVNKRKKSLAAKHGALPSLTIE